VQKPMAPLPCTIPLKPRFARLPSPFQRGTGAGGGTHNCKALAGEPTNGRTHFVDSGASADGQAMRIRRLLDAGDLEGARFPSSAGGPCRSVIRSP